jgi:outer membrane receptor protein involved in Fe transport
MKFQRFGNASLSILILGWAAFSAGYPAGQANAQDVSAAATAAPAKTDVLEEVVVTSRLRKETAAEAPIVVNALSSLQLEQQGIVDMQGLAAAVPSVHVTGFFQSDSLFIRGIGNNGTNSGFEQQVGLFVDGIYYGNGHWINSAYVDLDTAEVLEGPQGVYLGKNTIGGAFNLKTKDPTDQLTASVKAGYEAVAQERYVEAVLSGPITDTLTGRIVVRADAMEGWAKAYLTGTSEPGTNDTVARLTLQWKPTDNFDATFKAQIDRYNDNGPNSTGTLVHCGGPNNTPSPLLRFGVAGTAPCVVSTNIPVVQYTNAGDSYSHIPSYTTALTMHWRNDYGELTSVTGLNRYGYVSLGNQNFSTFDGIDGYNQSRNEQISTELRYQTKLDFPVNFLVGAYYQSTAYENQLDSNIYPMALEGSEWTFERFDHQAGQSKSAFVEAQWQITDTLELDASARYTDESKSAYFIERNVAPYAPALALYGPIGAVITPRPVENYNVSPQAILTWKPTADVMAYAAYKTGFLAGGYSLTSQPSPRTNLATLEFGAEKVRGGEIGTKFFLMDRTVQLNADAYYYEYAGLQENVFNPVTIGYTVQNAAQSLTKGIELSGTGKLGYGLTFTGNVAYNKSEFQDYIGSCTPSAALHPGVGPCNVAQGHGVFGENFAGVPTSMAPVWAGRAQLGYEKEFGDYLFHAAVAANLSDKYIVGDVYNQSGWVKMDASMSVDYGPWTAAVIGRNLNGALTCGVSSARPLTSTAELRCILERPAEVRLEATYHY